MNLEFKPDFFSTANASWTSVSEEQARKLSAVVSVLKTHKFLTNSFEQVGALEINSSNFRLQSSNNNRYLLKSWPKTKEKLQLEKQLEIMEWLSQRGVNVVAPLRWLDGTFFRFAEERFWAIFPFCDGEYFSGRGNQLSSVISSILDLQKELSILPLNLWPDSGPLHFKEEDRKTIMEMGERQREWAVLLGDSIAPLLRESWSEIIYNWERTVELFPKIINMPVHYDLHPHNIIMYDNQVKAILDFDSCAVMNSGVGIAFAALKLCRQTMVVKPDTKLKEDFFDQLAKNDQFSYLIPHLRELACAEVLRRIAIILRLSQDGDQRWNHVLPIQLQHLKECDYFFGGSIYAG